MDQPKPQQFLPQFTPVPRAKDRHNGWKPEVQRAFIEALAETGSVKSAARRVGRAEVGAYLLRRHPEAHEFRAAWDIALDIGMRRIEDVAMDRALHGVETPVYSYGKLVGTRRVYNDYLLMFMLRNRAPERFAGGQAKAMNAVDQMELTRLKKQWRKEWEAESKRERAIRDNEQARQSESNLIEGIASMHQRWFTELGPRSRAAYRSFREIELAEEEERRDMRWSDIDLEIAQEDLAQAGDHWEEEEARDAVTLAERTRSAHEADRAAAEAEYAEWFTQERRAKVWWVIDVVFGALSRGDGGEEEGE
ncbi:MAG: hypothetical protein KGZ65_10495 [Sphingomonadales bacterium]|nr:hypothetical protein [Sphingomonadaceae bacterium]MBS3931654.1 hypothetical protein [Sphingomonadales bacterium]